MKAILAVLLALAAAQPVAAEIRYTREMSVGPVRSAPGNQAPVVRRNLKSGAAVDVLGTDPTGAFAHIRLGNLDGWVPTQYLVNQPDEDQQKIQSLQDENSKLLAQVRAYEESHKQLEKQSQESVLQAQKAVEELSETRKLTSNAAQLNENNKALVKENEMLKTDVGVLNGKIQRLEERSSQQWMLSYLLAIAFGVVLALVIPRLAPRRRSNGWS